MEPRHGRVTTIVRLAGQLLAASKPRLVVLLAGSLAVAFAASAIATASVASIATSRQLVADGWRGAYDILVRPAGATRVTIDGRDIVPSNYLASRTDSGISRAEWASIRSIPGVDVAAPVAALGWMRPSDEPVNLDLARPRADELLRVEVTTVMGAHESTTAAYVAVAPDGSVPIFAGATDLSIGDTHISVGLGVLPSAYGLVVGVDPSEENALIGLDTYVDGRALDPGLHHVRDDSFGTNAVAVPVVTATGVSLPGTVRVDAQVIGSVDVNEVVDGLIEAGGGFEDGSSMLSGDEQVSYVDGEVADAPRKSIFDVTRPLSDLVSPLRDKQVHVDATGAVSAIDDPTGTAGWSVGRNAILLPSPVPYARGVNDQLILRASGSWTADVAPRIAELQPKQFAPLPIGLAVDDPIYRPLQVVAPRPFVVQATGTYDLGAISDRFETAQNYAPLGIYTDVPRRLSAASGSDGHVTDLPSSLNPGGLNPLPPVGLTNLESVEALRGKNFIDAVRVRVAGISGYSSAAMARIDEVAAAIKNRTGLDVIVVAGSSPVDQPVEVAGVGTVIERWTTLGEAPRITRASAGFSGALLWAALGVVVLYLLTFGMFLVGGHAAELDTLGLLGWRRRTTISLLVFEAALVGAAAAVMSAVVTELVAEAMHIAVSPMVVVVGAAIVLMLHMAATALVATTALRRHRRPVVRAAADPGRTPAPRGVRSLALTNVLQSRVRAAVLVVALAAAVAVAGLVAALQAGFDGNLSTSLFGHFVAVRLGPYYLLAVAAAVFAATALTVDSGLLAVERRLGLLGLLRAIGWRDGDVRRLMRLEVTLPALAAAALATTVVVIVAASLDLSAVVIAAVACLTPLVAVGVAAFAARPAVSVATAGPPSDSLRAEGSSAALPGLTARSAMTSLGTFSVAIVAAAVAWAVVAPTNIPESAVLPTPTASPRPESEVRVAEDIAAIAAAPDRVPGEAALDDAMTYATDQLVAAGYTVTEVPYVAITPRLLSRSGAPIDRETFATSLFAVALAIKPDEARDSAGAGRVFDNPQYIDASDGLLPDLPCPASIVVVRIGRAVTDRTHSSYAHKVYNACGGQTPAVLAVTAPDEDWASLPGTVAAMSFATGHHVIAGPSTESPATASIPWVIANVASSGPGASDSAAPVAATLEIARLAAASHVAIRIGIAVDGDGALATFARAVAERAVGSRAIVIGAFGGRLDPAVGTLGQPHGFTDDDLNRILRAFVVEDAGAGAWASRTVSFQPTSDDWILAVADATNTEPADIAGMNLPLLAAGLNSAVVREEPGDSGLTSIAGTPADTVSEIDVGVVARLAQQLMHALASGR